MCTIWRMQRSDDAGTNQSHRGTSTKGEMERSVDFILRRAWLEIDEKNTPDESHCFDCNCFVCLIGSLDRSCSHWLGSEQCATVMLKKKRIVFIITPSPPPLWFRFEVLFMHFKTTHQAPIWAVFVVLRGILLSYLHFCQGSSFKVV